MFRATRRWFKTKIRKSKTFTDFARQLSWVLGYQLVPLDWRGAATIGGVQYSYEDIVLRRYAPWSTDADFQEIYLAVRPYTLVDIYRCYELWDLAAQAEEIEGDIIEVGVWRGGTGAVLATAAARWSRPTTVWLCDTFSGVVKAGIMDSTYRGGEHADTSVDEVQSLLDRLRLTNCRILPGVFPDQTARAIPDCRICLLHVDVDVYESARAIVEWASPRMKPRALLVFDDYGFMNCTGVTRLVNELRKTGNWTSLYNLNGHAVLIMN